MARSRNIKPSIMDNEELAELDPLTRILFIYLWMLADREGRLEDRPKRIGAQALPYDRTTDANQMLESLCELGFIDRYEAVGIACIQVNSFLKHQTPHGTEKDSVLPNKEGLFTVHTRGKNGYSTGEVSLVNCLLTVKKLSTNTLIPDSLIPDSLIPDSLVKTEPKQPAARRATAVATPDGVSDELWADFKKLRATKKAAITQTAIDGISREAALSGLTLSDALTMCCERGWSGFKASWTHQQSNGQPVNKQTALEDRNRAVAQRWASGGIMDGVI